MLYAFGFEKVAVVISDLYFVDPKPGVGQEGPERGARLEVRITEQPTREGSVYAARPISVEKPVWRADLLESVASEPGSYDRTHHHPTFRGWEPGKRNFVPEMSADPIGWVSEQLSDLDALLARAEVSADEVGPHDAEELRHAVPEISQALQGLLARVHAGELAKAPELVPANGSATVIRTGWL